MQPNPTLLRGMTIRRSATPGTQCAAGPYFIGAAKRYFFTVFHGVGAPGPDRTVEANLGGFGWTAIGDFVTGAQNDRVDWAIVQLYDTIVIDDQPPANVVNPATGVAYSHQAGGTVLFPANAVQRGD